MRTVVVLLLAFLLLALPACQMNERLSGTTFGVLGGGVLGGLLGDSVGGALIGGLAGGLTGYLVGDYFADQRERGRGTTPAPAAYPSSYAPAGTAPARYGPTTTTGLSPRSVAPVATAPVRYAPRSDVRAALEEGRRAATLPEALASYRRAIALDPNHADAWNAYGLSLMANGQRMEARDAFQRALSLDPRHYAASRNLEWANGGAR